MPLETRAWGRRKTCTLLKFLLAHRGDVLAVDQILDALYPHADPQRAAGNLRTRISELRRGLESHLKCGADSQYVLRVAPGCYLFSKDAPCRVDIELFEGHLRAARKLVHQQQWPEALEHFEEAVALYGGDFLAEDRYEEWTLAFREHYRQLFHEALEGCSDLYARSRRYAEAVATLQRVLEDDPCRESAYQRLMLYENDRGDTQKALQAYERCVKELRAQIDREPSPETRSLAERIRKGLVEREAN